METFSFIEKLTPVFVPHHEGLYQKNSTLRIRFPPFSKCGLKKHLAQKPKRDVDSPLGKPNRTNAFH